MVEIRIFRKQLTDSKRCSFCRIELTPEKECIINQDPFEVYCLECGLRVAKRESIFTKLRIEQHKKQIVLDQLEIKRLEEIDHINKIEKIKGLIRKNV